MNNITIDTEKLTELLKFAYEEGYNYKAYLEYSGKYYFNNDAKDKAINNILSIAGVKKEAAK